MNPVDSCRLMAGKEKDSRSRALLARQTCLLEAA
jgi:hypothetical protein